MKGIIDRFEGRFAIVETHDGFIKLERSSLPPEAGEGTHIILHENDVSIDQQATKRAQETVADLIKGL